MVDRNWKSSAVRAGTLSKYTGARGKFIYLFGELEYIKEGT
jgi:hypothetical protein